MSIIARIFKRLNIDFKRFLLKKEYQSEKQFDGGAVMLQFIIGTMIGGTVGVFTMCLLAVSKSDVQIYTLNEKDGANGK